MVQQSITFGEFFDAVYEHDEIEPRFWMEEWVARVDDARWQEVRSTLLKDGWVLAFAQDMVYALQERMQSICTEALYSMTMQTSRTFLEHIEAVAKKFDIDASRICRSPSCASEAILMAQIRSRTSAI